MCLLVRIARARVPSLQIRSFRFNNHTFEYTLWGGREAVAVDDGFYQVACVVVSISFDSGI